MCRAPTHCRTGHVSSATPESREKARPAPIGSVAMNNPLHILQTLDWKLKRKTTHGFCLLSLMLFVAIGGLLSALAQTNEASSARSGLKVQQGLKLADVRVHDPFIVAHQPTKTYYPYRACGPRQREQESSNAVMNFLSVWRSFSVRALRLAPICGTLSRNYSTAFSHSTMARGANSRNRAWTRSSGLVR